MVKDIPGKWRFVAIEFSREEADFAGKETESSWFWKTLFLKNMLRYLHDFVIEASAGFFLLIRPHFL
ncbi:hypothetical protein [Anaerophaga thermohalophila]|uniref:hypothetical protein n=1 Tax=Anaerophaga thermohalophila TaxID=177400 RepID=UPI0002D67FCC|nr:hypothetical protein [Anaerophaga thermohalophila]